MIFLEGSRMYWEMTFYKLSGNLQKVSQSYCVWHHAIGRMAVNVLVMNKGLEAKKTRGKKWKRTTEVIPLFSFVPGLRNGSNCALYMQEARKKTQCGFKHEPKLQAVSWVLCWCLHLVSASLGHPSPQIGHFSSSCWPLYCQMRQSLISGWWLSSSIRDGEPKAGYPESELFERPR